MRNRQKRSIENRTVEMGTSGVNLFECEKRVAQVQKLCESQFEVANHQLLELLLLLQSLQSKLTKFLSGHSILVEATDSTEVR